MSSEGNPRTARYKRDLRRVISSLNKREEFLALHATLNKQLQEGVLPEARFCDHPLSGNWRDHRECHILPDVLLIYRITETTVDLVRLGSHSELFKK